MNGAHAGLAGATDKTLHVVDKNRFLRTEADLLQNAPVDPKIGLARPDLMRREFPFEMAEEFEMLFYVVEMEGVGVRNQIKRVMLLEPGKKPVHPRIFPENIVPVMTEGGKRYGNAEGLAGGPVELTRRDLPAREGLLEAGEEEALPDLARGKSGRGREPPRGFLDIVVDQHIAEIEDHGFYFRVFPLHRSADCNIIKMQGERETGFKHTAYAFNL